MPESSARDSARSRRLAAMVARAKYRRRTGPIPTLPLLEQALDALPPGPAELQGCPACPRCRKPMIWGAKGHRGTSRVISIYCDPHGVWGFACVQCLSGIKPAKRKGVPHGA